MYFLVSIRSSLILNHINLLYDNNHTISNYPFATTFLSDEEKDYLEKLGDAFRIGDIVQAKVVKITGDNVDLSTVDKDCGVLKAMCTRCRDYMHTTQKRDEVQCNSCNKKEKRKVSINYVNE